MWFLVFMACSGDADPQGGGGASAGQTREAAQAALTDALERRAQVADVAEAARKASRWEGEDPALDHLIGDALANVLMKPEEGLPLLTASPAQEDPAWQAAVLGAALRDGSEEALQDWPQRLDRAVDTHPVLRQLTVAARKDPSIGWELAERAVSACTLLDAAPQRGRRPAVGTVPDTLFAAATALGAEQVEVGRPDYLTDPDPLLGQRPFRCRRHRWLEEPALPSPIVKNAIVGARQGDDMAWLWVGPGLDLPEAMAASDAAQGARWLQAARILAEEAPSGVPEQRLSEELGEGLFPPGETP